MRISELIAQLVKMLATLGDEYVWVLDDTDPVPFIGFEDPVNKPRGIYIS